MSVIQITDHAVLRYLERCKGIDVASARNEIANKIDQNPKIERAAQWAGNASMKVKTSAGDVLVCRSNRVVTYWRK